MLWHSSAPSGIFTQEFLFCSFQRYLRVSGEWMRFIFCKPKENLKHLSWDYEINHQAFNLRQKYKRSVWKRRQEWVGQISLFKNPTWCSKAQYLIGIPLSNISVWGSVIVQWVSNVFLDSWRPHQKYSNRNCTDSSFHSLHCDAYEHEHIQRLRGGNYTRKAKAYCRGVNCEFHLLGLRKNRRGE